VYVLRLSSTFVTGNGPWTGGVLQFPRFDEATMATFFHNNSSLVPRMARRRLRNNEVPNRQSTDSRRLNGAHNMWLWLNPLIPKTWSYVFASAPTPSSAGAYHQLKGPIASDS
jgi:hypothetical protein